MEEAPQTGQALGQGDHIPGADYVGLVQLRLAFIKADLRPRVDHQGHAFPKGLKRLGA